MKNKPRLAIIMGVLIFSLVSAGIYINYQMDHILNQAGMLLDKDSGTFTSSENKLPAGPYDKNGFSKGSERLAAKTRTSSEANHNNPLINSSSSGNENLITDIQKKTGQPIAKQDLLKAGVILMRKLSAEDIRYLKKVALQDSLSREEYERSQEILLNRLSVEDINALKKLGKKYGSELKILNPNTQS